MSGSGHQFFFKKKAEAKADTKADTKADAKDQAAATELHEISSSVKVEPLKISVNDFYQTFKATIIQYLYKEKDDVLSKYKSHRLVLSRSHATEELLKENPDSIEIDIDRGAERALKAHRKIFWISQQKPSGIQCLNALMKYLQNEEIFGEDDRRTLFSDLCDTLGRLLKIERIPERSIFDRHDKARNAYILREAAVVIGKQLELEPKPDQPQAGILPGAGRSSSI